MNEQRVLVDLGKIRESFLYTDRMFPVHIRDTVTLDHEVDDALIAEAWERTKRVYPIIDSTMGYERDPNLYFEPGASDKYPYDHMYLVEAQEGASVPIKSMVPVLPGTDVAGCRPVSVSYYGRRITVSCYHSFVDGGGMLKILSTLIYSYLALYTGCEDEHPVVELREGRDIAQYFTTVNSDYVFAQPYTPTPLYTLPLDCLGFNDEDMVNDGTPLDPKVLTASMDVDASDFLRLCKSTGANPSAMLCALLARATFALNNNEAKSVVFELTMSMRNAFGLQDSIANAVGTALAYATRSDVDSKPLANMVQQIRADVTSQRGSDYYISHQRTFSMYDRVKYFKPRTVTYRGTFDIGKNNVHVTDFLFETGAAAALYFTQLNDRFVLTLQHGLATDKYLHAFERLFAELEVKASISHPTSIVSKESLVPVLADSIDERG